MHEGPKNYGQTSLANDNIFSNKHLCSMWYLAMQQEKCDSHPLYLPNDIDPSARMIVGDMM